MSERIRAYDDQIKREIHRQASVSLGDGGKVIVSLPCAKCTKPKPWTSNKMLPADAIAGKLRKAGWTLARNPVCPAHKKASPTKAASPSLGNDNEPVNNTAPTVETAPIISEPKKDPSIMTALATESPAPTTIALDPKAAKRETLKWLDESFNVEAGRYRDSHISDASIAAETGLTEEQVKELREDIYGALREPEELQQVRDAIADIEKAQAANNDLLVQSIERAATHVGRLGTQLHEARNRFAEVEAEHKKTCANLTKQFDSAHAHVEQLKKDLGESNARFAERIAALTTKLESVAKSFN